MKGRRNPGLAVLPNGDRGGLSGTFLVMHEMGHWAYRNLMNADMKLEFWQQMDKYYAANGTFNGGGKDAYGRTVVEQRTPFIKVTNPEDELFGAEIGAFNGAESPQEMFANQFALYMQRKHDAVYFPQDKKLWNKVTKLVKMLWSYMSGKKVHDLELEPLFDKMIVSRKEAKRVKFHMPVDLSLIHI